MPRRKSIMLFFKKKLQINSDEYLQLRRRLDLLDIEISLVSEKLVKAIKRKAVKKEEETDEEDYKNTQILPM